MTVGEPRIDAPRAVDQLAWWVQHGEELRLENERLRGEVGSLWAELNRLHGQFRYALRIAHIDGPVSDGPQTGAST